MSLLFVVAAAVLWGLIGVFVKAFTAAGLSAGDIASLRALSAFVLTALFLAFRSPKAFRIRLGDLWIFFGTGVFSFTAMNVAYFSSINRSGLMIASVLLYTSPVFIALFSALFFHEKITASKGAVLLMAVAGCALVSGLGGTPLQAAGLEGLLWGLGAGLSYGLYSIFGRAALNRGYEAGTLTFYTFAFAALGSPFFFHTGALWEKISSLWTPALFFGTAAFGLVCTVLPFFLYSKGLKGLSNTAAGVTACLEPVVASCIGILFYGERLSFLRACGVVLIIGAVVLLNTKLSGNSRRSSGL